MLRNSLQVKALRIGISYFAETPLDSSTAKEGEAPSDAHLVGQEKYRKS